jgi:flagellar hook-associated protein 1
MSISNLLLTASDSLIAQRMAIDITGGNVANVNTPGYTRQRLDLITVGSSNIRAADTQTSVAAGRVERIYDSYIESQVTEQKQNLGYSNTLLQGLQNVESILDDTSGNGINDRLNQFWSSWENLSNNPTGKVERNDLLSASQYLTDAIKSSKQNLDTINTDMNRNISETVSQINNKIKEIRDLNEKIFGTGNNEIQSNGALIDNRSQTLNDLSSLINISKLENADGTIDVYLSNGEPLVQGMSSQTLSVTLDPNGLSNNISITNKPNESLNSSLTNGKLGAFLALQNTVVPKYVKYINDFTTALSSRVNELHTNGFDTYKNIGVDFFTIADANNASGTIGVNSIITADPNKIASSETVTGDGVVASGIAAVQNELLMDNGTATLNTHLATMVGEIGSQTENAKKNDDYQTIIMNQLNNQRESVSGVSIDEEMILLIKYQTGYTAAGKLVTAAQDMLDTLMGLIK